MRRALLPVLTALCLTVAAAAPAAALTASPDARDRLGSTTKTVTAGTGLLETRLTALTSGYTRDFACGFLLSFDCATVRDIYGRISVLRVGSKATNPDLMKISMTTGFQGVGLSVGVMSPAGITVGFIDAGTSCRSPELESRPRAGYVSFRANGEICKAKTAGWVSAITISTNGYYRYGSRWRVITATYRRNVGGL